MLHNDNDFVRITTGDIDAELQARAVASFQEVVK